jgi:hypothetical protein
MGIAFCVIGFCGSFLLGRLALVAGLGAVLTTGYVFGILRANYLDTFTYFLFDAAVFGYYLALLMGQTSGAANLIVRPLRRWLVVLIVWSVLMSLLPLQHPLIQLVGLRGNTFLLPFLIVGAWLRREDALRLALCLAVLNHVAFAFALAEYFRGVSAFYPRNQVTEIIYRSADVAGATLRIPACFSNAASYGNCMVMTIPWLLGALFQPRLALWKRLVLASGLVLAMLGIFFCASRTPLVFLVLLILVTSFSGKLSGAFWLGWLIILGGIGYIVSAEERMQRFTTLKDTDYVVQRLEGSVNMNFFELLVAYPLGNGMGAGGTSLPYFLQHLVHNPVGLENEYSRILLEQGLPGLILWLTFIVWCGRRWPRERRDPWHFGRMLLWFLSMAIFAVALMGTGLMTAIPQSVMTFLGVGFAVTQVRLIKRKKRLRRPVTAFQVAEQPALV